MAFTSIVWPEFLIRAQFLRVIVPANTWFPTSARRVWDWLGDSVGNTIYSLCNMLRHGNGLRSVRVVMQPDTTSTFESMQSVLYPLRLLGAIELEMVDSANHSLANFYSLSDIPAIAPTAGLARLKLIYDCVELTYWLSRSPWAMQGSNSTVFGILIHVASTARCFTGNHDNSSPAWLQAFRTATMELRTGLKTRRIVRTLINFALLLKICAMLRLEVDLTLHAPENGDRSSRIAVWGLSTFDCMLHSKAVSAGKHGNH